MYAQTELFKERVPETFDSRILLTPVYSKFVPNLRILAGVGTD